MDLNVLSEIEITNLIILLNRAGLWGEYASKNERFKFDMIQHDCKSNIRLLLLKLLNSPSIINRFKEAINNVKDRKNFFEAITLILVSKVFGFSIDLEDLTYILDTEVLNKPAFQKDVAVRELVNFDQGKIIVKSSILSQVILSNILHSGGIVDTLIKVCKRLDTRRDDKNVRIILKELLSFSNLQRILQKDTADYKFNILRFFEEIRNTKFCHVNPHFWLQYAIARLAEREYELADSYFKTAYSYADKIEWFDSYQIDNHHARYLIENEIYNGSIESCMSQFLKAHKILTNQHDKNRTRHYPFRVAQNYYPFYEKYFKALKKQDKIIFIHSCKEILGRIELYMQSVDNYRIRSEVKKTHDLFEKIIEVENGKCA